MDLVYLDPLQEQPRLQRPLCGEGWLAIGGLRQILTKQRLPQSVQQTSGENHHVPAQPPTLDAV